MINGYDYYHKTLISRVSFTVQFYENNTIIVLITIGHSALPNLHLMPDMSGTR